MPTEFMYVSPTAPFLRLRLKSAGRIQFKNSVYKTEDEKVAAELDKLIATASNVAALVSKVDREKALALAETHKRMHNMGGAVKGAMSAGDIEAMQRRAEMEERDLQIARASADPKMAAAFSEILNENDLLLTQKGNVHRDSGEGFKEDKPVPKSDGEKAAKASVAAAFGGKSK
jgi:hypothetical protein